MHTLSSLGSQDLFWLWYPLSNVHAGGVDAETASKTWPDAQTPGLSSTLRQTLYCNSFRFIYSVHIRWSLDEDREPAKKGGGGLCNLTGRYMVNNSSNKPFPANDVLQAWFKKMITPDVFLSQKEQLQNKLRLLWSGRVCLDRPVVY